MERKIFDHKISVGTLLGAASVLLLATWLLACAPASGPTSAQPRTPDVYTGITPPSTATLENLIGRTEIEPPTTPEAARPSPDCLPQQNMTQHTAHSTTEPRTTTPETVIPDVTPDIPSLIELTEREFPDQTVETEGCTPSPETPIPPTEGE